MPAFFFVSRLVPSRALWPCQYVDRQRGGLCRVSCGRGGNCEGRIDRAADDRIPDQRRDDSYIAGRAARSGGKDNRGAGADFEPLTGVKYKTRPVRADGRGHAGHISTIDSDGERQVWRDRKAAAVATAAASHQCHRQ